MNLDLHAHKPAHLIVPQRIALRGHTLLTSPRFNKGTAFPVSERNSLGLAGRLPSKVNTLDEQCERAYGQLKQRDLPIRKNTFMQSLKDQNWTLYYALLARHLRELIPIIYTPTEAEAIESYSHLFRRSEGMFLTFPHQDAMEEVFLEQTRGRDLDLIVVTDAEAILGIGDQGVGGICISAAKSAIYTLIGGLDPSRSLSVTLDVGTNNKDLLDDPLYVGWREKRVRGEAYDKFVDKFVQLVRKYFPHCLLHFEDFGVTNAHKLLDRYRDTHAVFNDDIQGTGAVTLACVMSAIRISSRRRAEALDGNNPNPSCIRNRLADQRYIIFGAGSAGMGVAVQLRDAIMSEDGIEGIAANRKFWLIDREGLLYEDGNDDDEFHEDGLRHGFYRPAEEGWGEDGAESTPAGASGKKKKHVSLLEVVKRVRPTVLIGCSTAPGTFTKEVVEAVVEGLQDGEHPIILPLSNPSRLVEATPEDLIKWTNGRALIATGSPFPNVKWTVKDKEIDFLIGECNNALIYPGLGFGAIIAQSRCVTDTMLIAGARRLASLSPALNDTDGEYTGASLLPDFVDSPNVNFEVAVAVAEQAIKEGSAGERWLKGEPGWTLADVRDKVAEKVWVPVYTDYIYDEQGLQDL
ncbi:Aminoacid dehydrogenase-like protein [Pholiota conissans]|uniref:Malic enzyme n=1 Tax=Pholiota conissans TaxID=109636 RepID=A0A9P5Z1E2_9AGAR|nr:Aminoacid dehydrogenase-like protein [Pholiota conissans]